MTYTGIAKKLLEQYGVDIWDEVIVKWNKQEIKAIILPGPKTDRYIYLKLPNGYNLALRADNIKSIEKIRHIESKYSLPKFAKAINPNLPEISIIHAGGTIASRVDYHTGAIAPAFTPEELSWAVPEIFDIASLRLREAFNIFSENITPKHWLILASMIYDEFKSGARGVIITHGTDTMHFSAAAIAFMIENPVGPIVFTGAMRSSDRPASDAATNLIASTLVAREQRIFESVIVMHKQPDDTKFAVYRGVRTIKIHSTRRDAFRSIGIPYLAEVNLEEKKVIVNDELLLTNKGGMKLLNKFEEKIAMLYIYPGITSELIDVLVDRHYKGIVLIGTGMGHTPETLFASIKRATEEGVIIIMSTQCLSGGVFMNVYETGRKLLRLGVIPAHTMLPHTAYVKLGWLLGLNLEQKQIVSKFKENLRGEFVFRESLDEFIY